MLRCILSALLIIAVFSGFSVAMIAMFAEYTYTYIGHKEFETLEDAYNFQQEVTNEALRIDAKVENVGISVKSPPTVSWKIQLNQPTIFHINDNHEFAYGSKRVSKGEAQGCIGGLLGFCGTITLLMVVGVFKIDP